MTLLVSKNVAYTMERFVKAVNEVLISARKWKCHRKRIICLKLKGIIQNCWSYALGSQGGGGEMCVQNIYEIDKQLTGRLCRLWIVALVSCIIRGEPKTWPLSDVFFKVAIRHVCKINGKRSTWFTINNFPTSKI